jgi:hypothetical protein
MTCEAPHASGVGLWAGVGPRSRGGVVRRPSQLSHGEPQASLRLGFRT